jgi:hypothetical protein
MKQLIYQFIKQHLLGVINTANKDNTPEAALVGIAVSEDLEIIFDTVQRRASIITFYKTHR